MSDTPNYVEYRPPADGVPPKGWRAGMGWDCEPFRKDNSLYDDDMPDWYSSIRYRVPPEALNSPNDDASGDVDTWKQDDATRDMSTCNKCGRRYPSAPVGHIHKCSCSGGIMVRDSVAVKFVANAPCELSEFSDEQIVRFIQSWDDERKAKHGITLEPPKDRATELWHKAYDAFDSEHTYSEGHREAIEVLRQALIRERVVLKEGV